MITLVDGLLPDRGELGNRGELYESCSTRIAPFARAASRSVQPVPETMHQPIAFFMRWTASSAARRLGNVHDRRPGST